MPEKRCFYYVNVDSKYSCFIKFKSMLIELESNCHCAICHSVTFSQLNGWMELNKICQEDNLYPWDRHRLFKKHGMCKAVGSLKNSYIPSK